jgi:hypothetical protein
VVVILRKRLIAYCDGGLGNRLNALIGALYFARELDLDLLISWPINRWCSAGFDELFDSPYQSNDWGIPDINALSLSCLLVAHEQQVFNLPCAYNPNQWLSAVHLFSKLRLGLRDYSGLIYYNNIVPGYIRPIEIKSIILPIRVKNEYRKAADIWLAEMGLCCKSYWGLHLRGSDMHFSRLYYGFWFAVACLLPGPIVLCTDDYHIEERFLRIHKVVRRPAAALPQKANQNLSWNHENHDEYGRKFAFNVYRSAAVIRESLIDFEILCRSCIIPTSGSTFLANAIRFSGGNSFSSNLHTIARFFSYASKYLSAAAIKLMRVD